MIEIIYDPVHGTPSPDAHIAEIVKEALEGNTVRISTSNLFVVMSIGTKAVERGISESNIEMYFRPVSPHPERTLPLEKIGFNWPDNMLPKSFRDHVDSMLSGVFQE